MKITGLRTAQVEVPFERPIRTAIHHIAGVNCVLVWLDTDAGVTGEAYMFAFGRRRTDVLEAMAKGLAPVVIGRDAADIQAIWQAMWADINFLGHKGITLFALSAIDAALWDIAGKAQGKSVARLLGRMREKVPAYASEGLWVSSSIDELQAEAKGLVAKGFRAVKMRFGKPRFEEDVERAAAVREAIGPGIALMADANQGLTVNHAIRLGRAIERYNLTWFEEPVPAYDLDGHARIAAALDTPIASGETEYAVPGFADMIARRSADILMPDLQRVGGISEFMKVGAMAQAAGIPVSPHIFTEQSLQLCGAIANVNYAEHMPWFVPLFRERMEMDAEGNLLIPDRPGLGFSFDPEAVARYRVA